MNRPLDEYALPDSKLPRQMPLFHQSIESHLPKSIELASNKSEGPKSDGVFFFSLLRFSMLSRGRWGFADREEAKSTRRAEDAKSLLSYGPLRHVRWRP